MDFILEQGYDVKKGKLGEFQRWLAANEKEIRNSSPDGCEYMGTYVVVASSEKKAGFVRSLWRLDSYGAQDHLARAGKEPGPFRDLAIELSDFMDEDSENWSHSLFKAVVDATLYESS